VTKAPLVERDRDVLAQLAQEASVSVTVSIPLWDVDKARAIEPYVATPERRIGIVAKLADAGIPVGVNIAPMIPGLGDEDMVRTLEAARAAGASYAGFVFLRLPGVGAEVFEGRVRESLPLRADKILHKVREARGGKLYDARFGARQHGEGAYASQAEALFEATCRRLGLHRGHLAEAASRTGTFRRPPRSPEPGDQLTLL